jgi:hypothetical protein
MNNELPKVKLGNYGILPWTIILLYYNNIILQYYLWFIKKGYSKRTNYR